MKKYLLKKKPVLLIALCWGLLMTSCASKKDIVYFQSKKLVADIEAFNNYTPVFHADDILTITVSALDMEAAKPFNLPAVNYDLVSTDISSRPRQQTYLIAADGTIEFPVLGTIKLEGLTRSEAVKLLKERLKEYVTNPIVNIRITNFKISVLGEVNRPGSYTIPNERTTIIEALALAGDMTITGRRKHVLVIREINGKQTFTRIDLTSTDVFKSPVYYLSQNDVVYVEPNQPRVNASAYSRNTSVIVSVASVLISLIAVITR